MDDDGGNDDWSNDANDDDNSQSLSSNDWYEHGSARQRVAGVAGAAVAATGFWAMFRRRGKNQASAEAMLASNPLSMPAGSAETLWHYVVAGQTLGPERESLLRQRLARRELSEDTLVWNPQLPNWCAAWLAGLIAPPAAPAVPAVTTQWHYVQGGQAAGPVSEDELRALLARGALSATTLVWNSTLVEWSPAAAAGLTAPPAPLAPATANCSRCHCVLESGARFCCACGEPVVAAAAAAVLPSVRSCPRCAAALDPGDRFCTGCGMAQR